MCQPANQDARGRFERERHVAALLRGGPRGEKSFCLQGDPGPVFRCGRVTQALDAAWLQVCRLDPAGPSLDSSGAVFLLPQRQRKGSELSKTTFHFSVEDLNRPNASADPGVGLLWQHLVSMAVQRGD